jgi:pSer/pThr/pTyr-binding forkhead associated (FHA) protein
MNQAFWNIIDAHTGTGWWFRPAALLVCVGALLLLALIAPRMHRLGVRSAALAALAFGASIALLLPGALVAWQPAAALGIDMGAPARLPTATFPAAARTLDQIVQMGYIGGGVLVIGALSGLGAFGERRRRSCPDCGRERHPSWRGVCPECQLMKPSPAESPLMQLGDSSASGIPVTQFDIRAPTALLDGAAGPTSWVEVVQGTSGVGERFAVGARLAIGRDPGQCQLVLDDETISARHAYIERTDQAFAIYDCGSRNGTYVNDESVAHCALHPGDTIRVGRAVLRFCAEHAADSAPTELLDMGAALARLVVLDGPCAGTVVPLTRLDTWIGRSKQNEIVLDTPTVSRRHASVRFDGLDYHLVDAGTPNGTWLDETRVLGNALLHSGQIIRVGGQRLRFERGEVADVANN